LTLAALRAFLVTFTEVDAASRRGRGRRRCHGARRRTQEL